MTPSIVVAGSLNMDLVIRAPHIPRPGETIIGVDVDQYFTLFQGGAVPGADHQLSSAMKRIDNTVYQAIADGVAGTFTV